MAGGAGGRASVHRPGAAEAALAAGAPGAAAGQPHTSRSPASARRTHEVAGQARGAAAPLRRRAAAALLLAVLAVLAVLLVRAQGRRRQAVAALLLLPVLLSVQQLLGKGVSREGLQREAQVVEAGLAAGRLLQQVCRVPVGLRLVALAAAAQLSVAAGCRAGRCGRRARGGAWGCGREGERRRAQRRALWHSAV